MWFRRLLRPKPQPGRSLRPGRLNFELDAALSAQLRLAARARQQSTERLIADLLAQGLEREALRQQAETALSALTEREQEVARDCRGELGPIDRDMGGNARKTGNQEDGNGLGQRRQERDGPQPHLDECR